LGLNTPVILNPDDPERDRYVAGLNDEMPLFQADGTPHPKYPQLSVYFRTFTGEVAQRLSERPEAKAMIMAPSPYPPSERPDGPVGDPVHFPNVRCSIEEQIYFRTSSGFHALTAAHLSVSFQWYYKRVRSEYRILVDVQTQDIYAGAAITSAPIHEDLMLAFVLTHDSTIVEAGTVQLSYPPR
jgi:hypothetical protein